MEGNEKNLIRAAGLIANARHLVAFTGAGISVESGIPPFRGEEGIWTRYDPSVLDIDYFNADPEASWGVIVQIFYTYFLDARPNAAHMLLAQLEQCGILKAVITQNIDNLHREAGNREVIEYHGNSGFLVCTHCGNRYELTDVPLEPLPPRCENDRSVLKPDFTFFGEGIPAEAAERSMEEVTMADLLLIIGTTGEVMPAAMLPSVAKSNGAGIIEINPGPTAFTYGLTDLYLKGRAGEICESLGTYLF